MNPTPSQIDDALLDVRKAYRLLHDYQRSALDAVKYVGTHLGLEYWDGGPNFSYPAPRGSSSGLFDRWAWDWLNLYFYDFTFTRGVSKKDQVFLAVWLFSDTGYFLSDDDAGTKTDTSRFLPPDKSTTTVAFFFYRIWPDPPFFDNRAVVRNLLKTGGTLPKEYIAAGVQGVCHDFARLATVESADALIGELEVFAKLHGFPIERAKRLS